jgi:two-component system sensor histidine kinase RegB
MIGAPLTDEIDRRGAAGAAVLARHSSGVASGPPALRASLRLLMRLRGVAIAGQSLAIACAVYAGVALPLVPMAAVVVALLGWNGWTWLRLRSPQDPDHAEIATHLALDLAALGFLLYCSGGAANPFALLFVLHAVMIALLLPPVAAGCGAALVIACYVALIRIHRPLEMADGGALPRDLATLGHGVSVALTIGVTAWFVVRIVAALRAHERRLNDATGKLLRDEAVLRVGALAAGAAHELATPLTTMAVATDAILRDAPTPEIARDARIVAAQIAACRGTLGDLMAAAGHARSPGGGRERLDVFLESIAERCRLMHPEAAIASDWRDVPPGAEIFAEQSLRQALLSLLNNAVEASPRDVAFYARRSATALRVIVADRGSGLPNADLLRLGRAFFTTKPPGKGTGLGVMLAARAVEALGGSLRCDNRPGGGLAVEVALPLDTLALGSAP